MNRKTISESVHEAVAGYLEAMDDQQIANLYEMVLTEVEAPLLACVLAHTENNQSKTAQILGLNRGTLRKNCVSIDCCSYRNYYRNSYRNSYRDFYRNYYRGYP